MSKAYSKHAYLVLAHKNAEQLKQLLIALDHPRNDIFVHLDKRFSPCVNVDDLKKACRYSSIEVVSVFKSEWGSFELVRAELLLLGRASEKKHDYYHLVSGQCLPLKPQEEIHSFFESSGCEFVQFSKKDEWAECLAERLSTKRLPHFARCWLPGSGTIERGLAATQRALGVNRLDASIRYGFGSQWFSITHELAAEIAKNKKWICRHFSHGVCTDELFLQSFILTFSFEEKLAFPLDDSSYASCARYVDWTNGGNNPRTLNESDWQNLQSANYMFGRKFDHAKHPDLIANIVETVRYKPLPTTRLL